MTVPTGLTGFGAKLSNLPELLKEVFETPFVESVPRDNALLQRISKKAAKRDVVQWKIHYAGNESAGSYAETDEAPDAGMQSYIEAEIPIRLNWVTFGVTGLLEAATEGDGAWLAALSSETREALEDLKNALNDQMLAFTKENPTDLDGIGVIVSDTGTYAGINRATHSFWRSYVNDAEEPRPLEISLMQDQLMELEKKERKAKVSGIFCNRKHFYDYANLLDNQRRYVNTMKLDGGVEALAFEHIPVIPMLGMATGSMFFLDESEFEYRTLKNFETVELPVNGDARKFFTKHYSAFLCKHPGRQGRIDDLE